MNGPMIMEPIVIRLAINWHESRRPFPFILIIWHLSMMQRCEVGRQWESNSLTSSSSGWFNTENSFVVSTVAVSASIRNVPLWCLCWSPECELAAAKGVCTIRWNQVIVDYLSAKSGGCPPWNSFWVSVGPRHFCCVHSHCCTFSRTASAKAFSHILVLFTIEHWRWHSRRISRYGDNIERLIHKTQCSSDSEGISVPNGTIIIITWSFYIS